MDRDIVERVARVLREALEKIANMPAFGFYGGFRKPCIEIARAALSTKGSSV